MDDFSKLYSKMLNLITLFAILGVLAFLGALGVGLYFLLK
jgi:hypothetical protein